MSSPAREQIFADKIKSGSTIKQAMLDAGYPASRAKNGVKGCSRKMMKEVAKRGITLAEFGKSLSMDALKNIALGRLATNAIEGRDGGVMSAKTLGSHRDLNLWTPEHMAGVIVIAAPTRIAENKDKILDIPTEE